MHQFHSIQLLAINLPSQPISQLFHLVLIIKGQHLFKTFFYSVDFLIYVDISSFVITLKTQLKDDLNLAELSTVEPLLSDLFYLALLLT